MKVTVLLDKAGRVIGTVSQANTYGVGSAPRIGYVPLHGQSVDEVELSAEAFHNSDGAAFHAAVEHALAHARKGRVAPDAAEK